MSGRPADGRPTAPPRPLVARVEPRPPVRPRQIRPPEGRVRRFTRRYGWRAYAIPLLTLATIAVLVDLVLHRPVPSATAEPAPASAPAPVTSEPEPAPTGTVPPAEGDAGPSEPAAPAAVAEQYVEQGAGTLSVVDSTSDVLGSGPLQRFAVEVEDGIGVDGAAFADAVTATLGDPRSWGSGGRMSFQRVGAGAEYDFKVSLVSPGSMETYCPGVGTGGYTSCRYGERAVINLARWATAVPHYDGDIATYRQYVVNHEVGHALGNGHVGCPGPGQPAPVMVQQTLGLDGCVKNAWPYP
ncbi:DUF3152 domain-containing protein [Blastococcus xanthinilyticus]|uniref:Uncharacterized protein DUF3152 n=1 Tax=Blastococcus xanthinilyticus TaxID=1564164 RepID=A0A5S5D429_9ACTN|nr:DUF3152 domain-containing protein [Blastococcus xanthinilyticus]TYP89926.1 uncharacterized protein DUF3152 [Blastococcus xanthinilyticus]